MEAKWPRDLHAALAKAQQGVEIVIEQDHRPVAVLEPSAPARPGRKLSECIAMANFARNVQARIDARRDSFEPPPGD